MSAPTVSTPVVVLKACGHYYTTDDPQTALALVSSAYPRDRCVPCRRDVHVVAVIPCHAAMLTVHGWPAHAMSPAISAARRMQSAGPPVPRNRWDCPRCHEHGYSENAHAAYLAGTGHYERVHDVEDARARRLAATMATNPAPRPATCALTFTYQRGGTWDGDCDCGTWHVRGLASLALVDHAHRVHTIEAARIHERRQP